MQDFPLTNQIENLILDVAQVAMDETWSDTQGYAMAKAREIIELVKAQS